MGKRGPKPGFRKKKQISEKWSANLAYAIGLLATDGCLSSYFYHIDLTSNDREQLENFNTCIGIDFLIGRKMSNLGMTSLRVQFKNVIFYNFLLSVGLTPRKSKTLGPLKIPPEYFWDFLRGVYDGDGSSYSYWDKRWKSSFMFYTGFASASRKFVDWLQEEVFQRTGVKGHITCGSKASVLYQLRYAKKDSLLVLRGMYYKKTVVALSRKRLKVVDILGIVGEKL